MAVLLGELKLNNKSIFTTQDISNNFNCNEIYQYFIEGKLVSVCSKDIEIANKLKNINENKSKMDILRDLAEIFNASIDEQDCNSYEKSENKDDVDDVVFSDKKKIFETLTEGFQKLDISEDAKKEAMKVLLKIKEQKINILITGATGCGKSSTINALFGTEVAKVGVGVEPETMDIQKYELDSLILWDSPGLGDGKEADQRHSENIIKKLKEKDSKGEFLIDLVLVILDGSTRDLGTSYDLINSVIIPNLGDNIENRILVAINQADMAMKGRNWNYEENCPNQELINFLEEKAESVRKRIKEGTGVDITPIYYTAGYKEEGEIQCKPYNLTKLLYFIINYTPEEKRLNIVQNINKDEEVWEKDEYSTASEEHLEYVEPVVYQTEVDNSYNKTSPRTKKTYANHKQNTKSHPINYKEEINKSIQKSVKQSFGQKIVTAVKSAAKKIGNFFKNLFK